MYWCGNSQRLRENVLFPDQQENTTEGSREFTGQQRLLSSHPDCSVLWLVALLYTEHSRPQLLQSENSAHVQKAVLLLCVQVVLSLKINQSCQRALTLHRQTIYHDSLPLLNLFGKRPTVLIAFSPTPLWRNDEIQCRDVCKETQAETRRQFNYARLVPTAIGTWDIS